jgi:hypothetical protein
MMTVNFIRLRNDKFIASAIREHDRQRAAVISKAILDESSRCMVDMNIWGL